MHPVVEFARRKLLERADVMEELAVAVVRTQRPELRDAKIDLYTDLVLQRIRDCEREILPVLFDVVSETERCEMAAVYEKYKDCALGDAGHPHSA